MSRIIRVESRERRLSSAIRRVSSIIVMESGSRLLNRFKFTNKTIYHIYLWIQVTSSQVDEQQVITCKDLNTQVCG